MWFVRLAILALVFSMLTGCIARYETVYRYQSPQSKDGKTCVKHCLGSRQNCMKWLKKKHFKACLPKRAWPRDAKPSMQELKDCTLPKSITERCWSSYHACYRLCGGEVNSYEQCVANCD